MLIFVLGWIVVSLGFSSSVVRNDVPRKDQNGNILDAHDGKMIRGKDGAFLWFAASYGNCMEPKGSSGCAVVAPGACGFRLDHNVSLYTSRDLVNWTSHSDPVFQIANTSLAQQKAIMFCPKVLFCSFTGKWVLWFNYIKGE